MDEDLRDYKLYCDERHTNLNERIGSMEKWLSKVDNRMWAILIGIAGQLLLTFIAILLFSKGIKT